MTQKRRSSASWGDGGIAATAILLTAVISGGLVLIETAASVTAASRPGQEDMRLITGFADVFAAVVLVGVLAALVALAAQFIGAGAGLVGLAAVWFLTIPLVEQRRFAATAIVLALSFAFTIALPAFALLGSVGALVAAGASYFYWQRYRIPLTAALGIAFAVAFPAFLFLGTQGAMPWSRNASDISEFALFRLSSYSALFVGLALFAIAMRWDFSDRERLTRRSDVAFWLHLLAGPLTVHGLFSLLGVARFDADIVNPWPVVALFALFTLTALVIDRRPLLIASFGYFLFALGQIIYRQIGASAEGAQRAINVPQVIMAAALGGGVLVAILAGAWSPLRHAALTLLPAAIADRVPPAPAGATPAAALARDSAPGESEPLRLVLGLNDYLATLGLSVLFAGALVGSYVIMARQMMDLGDLVGFAAARQFTALWAGPQPWLALAVPAGAILMAAEVFVRRQRMALTAVVAASLFAVLTFLAAMLFFWQAGVSPQVTAALQSLNQNSSDWFRISPGLFSAAIIGAALANWGFGWLNRIPVAAAWGVLMLVPLLFLDQIMVLTAASFAAPELPEASVRLRLVGFGLAAFVAALLLDRSDPDRKSQRADFAFWLHLLASLFAVTILFVEVQQAIGATGWRGVAALLAYALLILLALATNRRAPLLVGIPFVLTALGDGDGRADMLIRLVFFAAMMALVLAWDRIRARALALAGR
jgi:hypothetical protein